MKYDFDKQPDRTGTGSVKWDFAGDALPMWVADMDIETFPGIKEALVRRASHGIYGYTYDTPAWGDAYTYWWRTRHSFDFGKEDLVFATAVVPAIASAVRKLTAISENVLIQTPVYPVFFSSITNNGRTVVENKLLYDRETGLYSIDWDDLEKKLSDPQTTLMVLCNPQNPTGNIWDKETLVRIGDLCEKNNVRVVSDEIHCDIVAPGKEYVPFLSASETNRKIGVACISPTKTFNIAGIQTAAVVAMNPDLRQKMWRQINSDDVGEGNCFSYEAAAAAFTPEGAEWLDELREYLWANRTFAQDYIRDNIGVIKAVPSDASYLCWVDCSDITDDSRAFTDDLKNNGKVFFNPGVDFGGNGESFIRINLACPRQMLTDALERLKNHISRMNRN